MFKLNNLQHTIHLLHSKLDKITELSKSLVQYLVDVGYRKLKKCFSETTVHRLMYFRQVEWSLQFRLRPQTNYQVWQRIAG